MALHILNLPDHPDYLIAAEKEFYLTLGSVIRRIRRSKEISQEYMANKLNISQNVYSKIERGKCSCSVYRLFSIMELLHIEGAEMLALIQWN